MKGTCKNTNSIWPSKPIMRELLYLIIFLFLSGCSTFYQNIDGTRKVKQVVNVWSNIQPSPRWQTLVRAQDADLIEVLPNGQLLVGLLKVESTLLTYAGREPVHGDLVLLNGDTGKEIWHLARTPISGGEYSLVYSGNPLVIRGSAPDKATIYQGVDPETGVEIWKHEFEGEKKFIVSKTRNALVSLSQKADSWTMSAINLSNGKLLWSLSSKDELVSQMPYLVILNDTVYAIDEKVKAYRLKDGAQRWSRSSGYSDFGMLDAATDTNTIYVASESKITAFDAKNGRKRFAKNFISGVIESMSPVGNLLIVTSRNPDKDLESTRIQAISTKTGRYFWGGTEKYKLQSQILIKGSRIYYTTKEHVISRKKIMVKLFTVHL